MYTKATDKEARRRKEIQEENKQGRGRERWINKKD